MLCLSSRFEESSLPPLYLRDKVTLPITLISIKAPKYKSKSLIISLMMNTPEQQPVLCRRTAPQGIRFVPLLLLYRWGILGTVVIFLRLSSGSQYLFKIICIRNYFLQHLRENLNDFYLDWRKNDRKYLYFNSSDEIQYH